MNANKENRPKNNPLFQQQLQAWKPLLTFKDATIFFLCTGVILLGIGIAVYEADQSIVQYIFDYTDCPGSLNGTSVICSSVSSPGCVCVMNFTVSTTIPAPVYIYYGLTSYYQNIRRLVNSYDMTQLMGLPISSLSNTCIPFLSDNMSRYYAPCGGMANVIFNDTFMFTIQGNIELLPWDKTKIARDSDTRRYGNPGTWLNTIKPQNWPYPINATYVNGYKDDYDLMVWMRPAPLPSFRKLYSVLQTNGIYQNGLPPNNYSVKINYNYPVKVFGGTKSLIISNASWMGGRSLAIAILYFITGIIMIIITIILILVNVKMSYLQSSQKRAITKTSEM